MLVSNTCPVTLPAGSRYKDLYTIWRSWVYYMMTGEVFVRLFSNQAGQTAVRIENYSR